MRDEPAPGSAPGAAVLPPVAPRDVPAGALLRVLDVTVAALLLVVLAPLFVVLAVVIRLDSRGPALYRGERLGLGRRPFTVYKFRSMRVDADDDVHRRYLLELLQADDVERHAADDVKFKLPEDPRVTRVGRWIRMTTLDELPQLLNVVKGDMSLVGPRPEVPYALDAYEDWHHERFSVLPGMTGLWQVSGRGELPPAAMLALDVEYARTAGPVRDLAILARTLPAVLRRSGAR